MKDKAKTWIDLALSDLKSSRILHENKQFRTSYFHLQQASEKANSDAAYAANKTYGVWSSSVADQMIINANMIFTKAHL